MSDIPLTINGELLRLKRESHGWLISDMATRACMSTKQIRQLEEGGSSAFYSESVKFTSAKKVGGILGLTPDEVFGVPASEPVTSSAEVAEETAVSNNVVVTADNEVPGEPPVPVPVTETATAAGALSESSPSSDNTPEQKNKTPLGAIAALFVAALAVAAWMRPETEPVSVEPPPPLQTLPAETPDAAASAASSDAALPEPVASSAIGAASAPVSAASTVTAASSPVRPVAPSGSTPVGSAPPISTVPPASKPL
jgi:transcriptional regulator with XRE-family HTH domain